MTQAELRRWYYLPSKDKTKQQEQEILDFIKQIPDSYIADIFKFRYIEHLTWYQVAMNIGGGNTPDCMRKTAKRYLARNERKQKCQVKEN